MNRYKDLERRYEQLMEKYNRLSGEKSELEYSLSEQKASMDRLYEQDGEIRGLHENVRRLKHDMKNHLMVIASYLNTGDHASAAAYISQILDKLNAVHSYIETGNSLLNHILNEKLEYARTKGISIKAEIGNLSFGKMESMDFSALLSNLLDNAIEACAKEQEPMLSVNISRRRGYETILVKNRISRSVLGDNPALSTTKPEQDSHGMGIPRVREITEKYKGMCDFYEEEGFFCSCVFIPA